MLPSGQHAGLCLSCLFPMRCQALVREYPEGRSDCQPQKIVQKRLGPITTLFCHCRHVICPGSFSVSAVDPRRL
jgi:hypothetical protein